MAWLELRKKQKRYTKIIKMNSQELIEDSKVNPASFSLLLKEHSSLIYFICSKFFIKGLTQDDLCQIAKLQLWEHMKDYDSSKGIFTNFIFLVVRRKLIIELSKSKQVSRAPDVLLSMDTERVAGSDGVNLHGLIERKDDRLDEKEEYKCLEDSLLQYLSEKEKEIYIKYKDKTVYDKINYKIDGKVTKEYKEIDNTLQRIKSKARNLYKIYEITDTIIGKNKQIRRKQMSQIRTLNCQFCRHEFTQERKGQLFCSVRCKKDDRNKMLKEERRSKKKFCKECGVVEIELLKQYCSKCLWERQQAREVKLRTSGRNSKYQKDYYVKKKDNLEKIDKILQDPIENDKEIEEIIQKTVEKTEKKKQITRKNRIINKEKQMSTAKQRKTEQEVVSVKIQKEMEKCWSTYGKLTYQKTNIDNEIRTVLETMNALGQKLKE